MIKIQSWHTKHEKQLIKIKHSENIIENTKLIITNWKQKLLTNINTKWWYKYIMNKDKINYSEHRLNKRNQRLSYKHEYKTKKKSE